MSTTENELRALSCAKPDTSNLQGGTGVGKDCLPIEPVDDSSTDKGDPEVKNQQTETKITSNPNPALDSSMNSAQNASKGKKIPQVPLPKTDSSGFKLRFLFANRDGLNVTIECQVTDTVGEIKGALLSVWPKDLPDCSGGESIRLICMGKGILMPDSKTLADCEVPVFKTHPTPINVSVKPEHVVAAEKAKMSAPSNNQSSSSSVEQGCSCVIL